MDKLKSAWAWIVSAHDWIIQSIAAHPAATFWIGGALLILAIIF